MSEEVTKMKITKSKNFACIFVLLLLTSLSAPIIFVNPVHALSTVNITVDSETVTDVNDFSLGFMLDQEWNEWRDSSASRELARDANFKLVRVIDFKSTSPKPCTYWYESSRTGNFDWEETDKLIERIFEVGAEPLITLGSFSGYNTRPSIPRGMAVSSSTGLPYPESFAAYCKAWVQHFKSKGWPVRYYEIFNEAWYYFFRSWGNCDSTKRYNFVQLFNTVYRRMREADSKVLIGTDSSTFKCFLDYFVENGEGLGFLSLHKYDSGSTSDSDSSILSWVETKGFETSSSYYSPQQAKQVYYNARRVNLPVIISETNLSYIWRDGSDPRIQKVVGAVWTALMIRSCILKDVQYSTYYCFSSSKYYESRKNTGGYGFGMVNRDDDKPWYPYYVQKMVGENLAVGDQIVKTTSSSSTIRPLAWIHGDKLNILITCRDNQAKYLQLYGLQGQVNYYKIDNTVSYKTPRVQTGSTDSTKALYLNGYTVMLIQQDVSAPPPPPPPPPPGAHVFEDDFESGDFNAWSSTYSSTGETTTVKSKVGYNSVYGASFTTSGNGGYEYAQARKTITGMSQLYARAYVKVVTNGIADSGDKLYFITFRAGSDNVLSAGWKQSGSVLRWHLSIRDGTGYSGVYSDSAPSPDQWYCIEAYWLKDGANGKGTLWVNEAQIISVLGKDTNNYGDATQVRFGNSEAYNVASTEVFGDSFVVADEYIGPLEEEPTQLFEDDFESGNFNKWTGTTTTSGETVTVASYDPYSGNYHGRFASNGGSEVEDAYCYMTVDQEKVYARGYFQINQGLPLSDNDDRFYFLRFRAGGQSLAGVGIRRHNGVEKWMVYGRDGSSWVWPTYATSPSIETYRWYCIELFWHKDAAQGRIEVYIDGQKIFEITSINTAYYGNIDSIQFGLVTATGVQNSLKVYGDSFAISETYIGP